MAFKFYVAKTWLDFLTKVKLSNIISTIHKKSENKLENFKWIHFYYMRLEGINMKRRNINNYISLIVIFSFCVSLFSPFILPSYAGSENDTSVASEQTAAPAKSKNIISSAIDKLKPSDGLTIGERASNMVDKIKTGEPILDTKGGKIDYSGMSSTGAALEAGKISVKNAFSVKNIGFSAASTVGMNLFEQVKNGEKLDIGKAASELATGKYIGSLIGSGLGSAAGSALGTLMATSIPVVGPILGAFMPSLFSMTAGAMAGQMGSDIDSGKIPSFKRAWAAIDKVDLVGRVVGTTVGAAIGSLLLPGIGTAIGSFLGGIIGSKIAGLFKKKETTGKVNKTDNVRYGVDPGTTLNVVPIADPSLYLLYGSEEIKLGTRAKELKDKVVNAYRRYVQLLSSNKATSAECQSAVNDYKRTVSEYQTYIKAVLSESKASD